MQVIWTSAKGTKRVYIIRSHNPQFISTFICFTMDVLHRNLSWPSDWWGCSCNWRPKWKWGGIL